MQEKTQKTAIPAQAGIYSCANMRMDSRLRGNDAQLRFLSETAINQRFIKPNTNTCAPKTLLATYYFFRRQSHIQK